MGTQSLINRIKYSALLYTCYYYCGNLFINLLKIFVKCRDNRILFISFGGRRYDDSPKVIYEEMLTDQRFDSYELIWAFQNPDCFEIKRGRKIKTDTFNYFINILSARVWVTNSRVERGLNFKGKHTFYLNTWHGTPIKRMGVDIDKKNLSFRGKDRWNFTDIMLAQGRYEADIFSRVFNIPCERFAIIGLPRNDELIANNRSDIISGLRAKIGIPSNKKVILYAPTFREYNKDKCNNCIMTLPINVDKWSKKLGKTHILLIRAHYEVVTDMSVDNSFVINVSAYPNLNDLMLASDILISDYSSIFFDYSILGRPMIPYCYDYEKYSKERGMYFDIRQALCCSIENEDELINEILNIDEERRCAIANNFRKKYIDSAGYAGKKAIELIVSKLQ